MESVKARLYQFKPALILFYLSFTGFLGVMSVQHYLNLTLDPLICCCSMGLIFGVYTFNRFTDVKEDFANDIGKFLFFEKQRKFLSLAIITIVFPIGVLAKMGKLNILHISLLIIGFGYSYPIIPWFSKSKGIHLIRLKEIIFLKNLLVSLLWPIGLLAIPILYSNTVVHNLFGVYLIGSTFFITILNNTLLHDIMDEFGDRIAGIKTLPTSWGARKCYALLWILDLVWVLFVGLLYFMNQINGTQGLFLSFLTLYPALYLLVFYFGKATRVTMELLTESDLIFFSIGMVLISPG